MPRVLRLRNIAIAVCTCALIGCKPAPASSDISTTTLDKESEAEVIYQHADDTLDPRMAILMNMRVDARARTPENGRASNRTLQSAFGEGAELIGSVDGSFTNAGAKETIYLAEDHDGTRWIVVSGALSFKFSSTDAKAILASPDVNSDSLNEILVRTDRTERGVVVTDLGLISLLEGKPKQVLVFPDVRVDSCRDDTGVVQAEQIVYGAPKEGQAWPVFVAARYESACIDGSAPDFQTFVQNERRIDRRSE